uniref:Uncharacterized protein n=1 Tax=Thermogemmatispora argillosa TaxID=2045280 RepID=A0A455T104_9CHLR|nr:hypothetical protein KTA_03040 [Thermogemmatispora argillosa]
MSPVRSGDRDRYRATQQEAEPTLSPARRKRLLKTYGPAPSGYTTEDLERFLDLLYGLYSHISSPKALREIIVSDPFDRREQPRQLRLVELAAWLEAIIS